MADIQNLPNRIKQEVANTLDAADLLPCQDCGQKLKPHLMLVIYRGGKLHRAICRRCDNRTRADTSMGGAALRHGITGPRKRRRVSS